ncbi:MAG: quinolinate synthase [Actinomycetota bacterium]|nr:quinolinate synthase [Actinomycetota bacterium]
MTTDLQVPGVGALPLGAPYAPDESLPADWAAQVRQLAEARNAVILAHNYMLPDVQDVAHHVGDSLALSRIAAASDASTIVFCGVHFMAETAKILAPSKTVLIPDLDAGCSLAASIEVSDVLAWKADHPHGVVVAYVNTSAAIKAEVDVCCTSSNAADVVRSIPEGKEIFFLPDQFLGAHVRRVTGREMDVWAGECHVHAEISPSDLRATLDANPDSDLLVHPECGCTTTALYLTSTGDLPADRTKVLSTGGMVEYARTTKAARVLVATETGILHQLRQLGGATEFMPVSPRAVCPYMKMITPAKLLRSLRENVFEVDVDPEVSRRARKSVERMVEIGQPSRGGE